VRNRLIINDLSYLQHATDSSTVVAGNAYAITDTITRTGPRYATSNAVALAQGESTATNAQTLARVLYYGNFSISLADARATAFAMSGNKTARSSSFSTSTSLSFSSFDI
jgi:hypothetical protein